MGPLRTPLLGQSLPLQGNLVTEGVKIEELGWFQKPEMFSCFLQNSSIKKVAERRWKTYQARNVLWLKFLHLEFQGVGKGASFQQLASNSLYWKLQRKKYEGCVNSTSIY